MLFIINIQTCERKGGLWLKNTYYLIDTENVGDRWIDLLDKVGKKEKLIVFYTCYHSKKMEEYLVRHVNNPHIMWIECVIGNNALDYQLIGVLSYLIAKHSGATFYIYSNDKGYRGIVEHWRACGIRIKQKEFEEFSKKKEKEKNKKTKDKRNRDKNKKKNEKQNEGGMDFFDLYCKGVDLSFEDKQLIREIARSVSVKNLYSWHNVLIMLLGQDKGLGLYSILKDNTEFRDILSTYLKEDEYRQAIRLISLILKKNGLNSAGAEDVFEIIKTHSCKDRSDMKLAFDDKFGKKPPQEYYSVMRPYFSILKEKSDGI